ncbi:MAG: LacI family DNA-binding transcriptional regulator [Anaerolineales bacterium]|nr:LacI family DNA-binding transcriptional regulator [Anaerolineales bacterium]
MRNKRSITIRDVAVAAGVSVSTVSRVLNNKDDVSIETQERVKTVIAEMGYASSLAARGMRSHRTNVIGLIMPDVVSLYSFAVLQGVNRAIAQLHYDLIVYTNGDIRKNETADQESYYVSLLNGSITDGVIVVAPAATKFSTAAPVVAIDPNNESPGCPAIISTNRDGALQAMDYLIGLGHRQIGHITGRLELVSAIRRLQGYKDGLAKAGIPYDENLVQVSDFTTETAYECAHRLFRLANPPTAIFASNDMSAIGVYRAAQELGLRIPEDLSVVGFDNLPETACLTPALTTIDQFLTEMGTIAVDMVVKLIRGEALESNLRKIATELIVRDSCQRMN